MIPQQPRDLNTQDIGQGLQLVIDNVAPIGFYLRYCCAIELKSKAGHSPGKCILRERRIE